MTCIQHYNSPLGGILLAADDTGLTGLWFDGAKYFADKLYKSVIPRAVRLSEAPSYGMPIQYYDKRSKGAAAYDDLTKEFLKKNRRK